MLEAESKLARHLQIVMDDWPAEAKQNTIDHVLAALNEQRRHERDACAALASKTGDTLTGDCTYRNGMDPETGEELCARRDECSCTEIIDCADTIAGKIRARNA